MNNSESYTQYFTPSTKSSVTPSVIEDLQVEKLDIETTPINPPRFGQITKSNFTTSDPKMDPESEVVTQQPKIPFSPLKFSRKAKASGILTKKKKNPRRYYYIKQGKNCKNIIRKYKTLKCRGKRSKKCRTIQKKRKVCKKIIKHKRAMERKSRKIQKK